MRTPRLPTAGSIPYLGRVLGPAHHRVHVPGLAVGVIVVVGLLAKGSGVGEATALATLEAVAHCHSAHLAHVGRKC